MLVLAVCLAVLAVIQLVCVLALIDQYRGLLQVRANVGLVDVAKPLELPGIATGITPSSVGLPLGLDTEDRTVVVFLSTRCSTCRTIAEGLRGSVRPPLWVVLEGASPEACAKWLSDVALAGERIVLDVHSDIARRLVLEVVPSGVVFEQGKLVRATSLPSVRQLQRLVYPPAIPARPLTPVVASH